MGKRLMHALRGFDTGPYQAFSRGSLKTSQAFCISLKRASASSRLP